MDKHSEIGHFIRRRREELGLSQEDLAKGLGYASPMSISNIERSRAGLSLKRVKDFAALLHVEEIELMRLALPRDARRIVSALRDVPHTDYDDAPAQVPVIGLVEAGREGFYDDQGYPVGSGMYNVIAPYDLRDENAYALEVSGESMTPKFEPKDVVLVSPNRELLNGRCGVVRLVSGEVMLKRVRFTGAHVLLESYNPAFEPVLAAREDLLFLHPVIWTKHHN